jgi:hypothetical protein
MKYGSITTDIIADGLVFNMDPANRASTIPSTSTTKTFNTLDTSISGSIITDGTWEAGSPPSFDFDGSDGYIQTNYAAGNNLSIFTINVWFKVDNASYNFSTLVSSRINGISTSKGFDLYVGSSGTGILTARIYQNAGTLVETGNVIANNQWNNAVMSYDGSTLFLYLNGLFINSTSANYSTSNANIVFGRWNADVSSTFANGNIGTTQIYNRALSANEVLHNYNALKSRFE